MGIIKFVGNAELSRSIGLEKCSLLKFKEMSNHFQARNIDYKTLLDNINRYELGKPEVTNFGDFIKKLYLITSNKLYKVVNSLKLSNDKSISVINSQKRDLDT